jgi:hypothetical protein
MMVDRGHIAAQALIRHPYIADTAAKVCPVLVLPVADIVAAAAVHHMAAGSDIRQSLRRKAAVDVGTTAADAKAAVVVAV